MSLEENKAIIRKVNEAFNKKDLTVINEFMAPDYVDHTNQIRGKENVKQFYTMAFKDFPDFYKTIEDISLRTIKCGFVIKLQERPLLARR